MREHVKNPVMTFPLKERINTERYIEGTEALYIPKTQIRDGINGRINQADSRVKSTIDLNAIS